MILVNHLYNSYFVKTKNDFLIIDNDKEYIYFESLKKDELIVINNSRYTKRIDNVLDIRIMIWLMNNYSNYNSLSYIKNIADVYKLIDKQIDFLKENKIFIQQSIKYTSFHLKMNRLFEFNYNENYLCKIKEKIHLKKDISNNLKEIMNEDIMTKSEDMILNEFTDDISYSFLNKIGKIFPSNTFLQNIDRKENIGLFKNDNNKRYLLIDFSSFEPAMLSLYLKNDNYASKDFYLRCSDYFKIQSKEFKLNFLSWLNGAGQKRLGIYFDKFNRFFKDVVNFKDSIKNNRFTNYFNHTMFYEYDYKKLGHLIQSTAYDYLLRWFSFLYDKFKDRDDIKFKWMLFDEFFIEVDENVNIDNIISSSKLNYRIKEY